MKRCLTLCLALMLALSAVACSGTEPEFVGFELTDVEELAAAGVFSEELESLDADMAYALYHLGDYGLTRGDLVNAAVLRSSGATCEEGVVLQVSAELGDEALQAMEAYLQSQIESNVDYRPNEIPKLENAIVEQRGDMVALVVANDIDKAKELLHIDG